MFGEPLLAHPAEIGGVHATWHPHPRDDADRDQHDADPDDEEHMVVRPPAIGRRTAILTCGQLTVCALGHKASGLCIREQRNLKTEPRLETCTLSQSTHHCSALGVGGARHRHRMDCGFISIWTVLAGVAVVPPLVMMWRWNDPRQTMSESIPEAVR